MLKTVENLKMKNWNFSNFSYAVYDSIHTGGNAGDKFDTKFLQI